MLGNRIGLPFSGGPLSLQSYLRRSGAVLALYSPLADGLNYGINSPFTTPWKDIVGKQSFIRKSDGSIITDAFNGTGSFLRDSNSDGLADGWTGVTAGTYSFINGEQTFTPTAQYGGIRNNTNVLKTGRVYVYIVNSKSSDNTVKVDATGTFLSNKIHTGSGSYEKIGTLKQATSDTSSGVFEASITSKTSSFVPITVKQAFYCDVTDYPELVGLTNQQKLDWCLANLEYEQADNNDAVLLNFARTTADGWEQRLLPNGKTMPFLKFDGVDSRGYVAKTSDLDITSNLERFSICFGVFTSAVLAPEYLFYVGDGPNASDVQYSVRLAADNSIRGGSTSGERYLSPPGSVTQGNFYDVRIHNYNNVIQCFVNGVQTLNEANNATYTSKNNFTLGAKFDNPTYSFHFRNSLAYICIFRGDSATQANVNRVADKLSRDYR